jgi:tetratricopeptide (TPR) repeat protein
MKFAILCCALATSLLAQSPTECRNLSSRGKRVEARVCFNKLTSSPNPAFRAEGFWGIGAYKEANEQFKLAVAAQPKNPDLRVRWGRLFLERFNPAEARNLFKEALDINPSHGPAYLGLAVAAAENFDQQAVEAATTAINFDRNLLEAQELLARLALEDNNIPKAIEEADKALKMSPNALNAMAVRASIDLLENKGTSPWFDKIFAIHPTYGEAYALAGHFFVLNRRYDEGIAMYRKAIELDGELNSARSELGINLMRMGEEDDAKKQLEIAFAAGYQSNATVNSLRLMDSYKNFETFKTSNTIVKLHKKEAGLLRPYFESELKRAITTFEKKYKLKLDRPVQLEVYPDHEDFAVRTLGMPGLGALGVTFGHVVAMDSPSGRKPGNFHWASTLWHELSHVFVLTATKHRVPRWFTEGMAVHEETAASPDWGDRLDTPVIKAIKEKKLLPVAELDRGFVRPKYPAQVVVSYFQAGRICDYINEKWGYGKLLEMMYAYAESMPTPQVIETKLGMKPEEFDKQFMVWLDKQVRPTVDGYDKWQASMKSLAAAARSKRHDEVIEEGKATISIYPEFVEGQSAYEVVADAFLAKGDKENARKQLEQYSKVGGRKPETLMKLAKWQQEAGDRKAAIHTLERLIYIYPLGEELHKTLGDLYIADGNPESAVRAYTAVVATNTIDQAGSRYNLARALLSAKRTEEAKEQLLLALETAPGYKPAQRMLLELSQ